MRPRREETVNVACVSVLCLSVSGSLCLSVFPSLCLSLAPSLASRLLPALLSPAVPYPLFCHSHLSLFLPLSLSPCASPILRSCLRRDSLLPCQGVPSYLRLSLWPTCHVKARTAPVEKPLVEIPSRFNPNPHHSNEMTDASNPSFWLRVQPTQPGGPDRSCKNSETSRST